MAPTHSPRSTSAPPHFFPAWHPQGRSGLRDMCTDPHQASTAKAGHLAKPAVHGPKNRHPVRDACVHYGVYHQASTTKVGHLPQQLYTDPNSSVPFGTPFFTPETGVHGQQNQRPFGTPFYTPEVHQTSTARAGHLPRQVHRRTSSIPSGHISAAAQLSTKRRLVSSFLRRCCSLGPCFGKSLRLRCRLGFCFCCSRSSF